MNSCYTCKHRHSYKETESWEMAHIYWWVHICDARPKVANLKQFPFNATECEKWEPAAKNHPVEAARNQRRPADLLGMFGRLE